MDLKQCKLSKTEWNNTEIPLNEHEIFILNVIKTGYANVNVRMNMNKSMFQMIKIENTPENESYLYEKYFEASVKEMVKKYGANNLTTSYSIKAKSSKKPKKVDVMRIENLDSILKSKRSEIFEYVMLDYCKSIMKSFSTGDNSYAHHLYTLIQLQKSSIENVNQYVGQFVKDLIVFGKKHTNIERIITGAYEFIEKNPALMKYEDVTLFSHQKELFSIFKSPSPKLVLYIAPTGTGKTLSPIGLSEQYRVIFICVSRHVGLALAKSAISMKKKIAFSFGCETASDIRLHYFAASSYSVNKRSGGIGKVDNSVGDKVEIMICDVQSYLTAMHYMLAFNDECDVVTYWDEPTITMDYETHELHGQINKNWRENKISKMVLSCATLPKEEEIQDALMDFRGKFDDVDIHCINSYDFKKSISLLNKDCMCVLPHLLYEKYDEMLRCVSYCENNMTLLRYFDLQEILNFVDYVHQYDHLLDDYRMDHYFASIDEITMNSMKAYYLTCLRHLKIESDKWPAIYAVLKGRQKSKFDKDSDNGAQMRRMRSTEHSATKGPQSMTKMQSLDGTLNHESETNKMSQLNGMMLTTRDAHTLTDGPTIFMANDVQKIGKFYIKTTNIPAVLFQNILSKISANNVIQEKMDKVEKKLEDKMNSLITDNENSDRKSDRKSEYDPEIRKLSSEVESLRSQIQAVQLEKVYVPNTLEHQKVWTGTNKSNPYMPKIDETMVKRIMELDVTDTMKILLLLGIGTFDNDSNDRYLEVMKELAYEQKLYIIIASTDYIYGTNYSFCHGYIGKDLTHMTQQKILQAMGRIGRNKIQQDYTVRFRDDSLIYRLFQPMEENLEAINMNNLFNSD